MKKQILIVTAILGVMPHLAMAEVYLGGKMGYSILQNSCKVDNKCDDDSFAGGVYAGYNGNDYLGIEAGYDWLGSFKSDLNTGSMVNEFDVKAFTLAPRLRYPLGAASIYAKLGVAFLDFNDSSETSLMGGWGVEYHFADNFTTRLEYQRIHDAVTLNNEDISVDSFFLGFSYRFGANETVAPTPIVEEKVVLVEPEPIKQEPVIVTKVFKEFGEKLFANDSTELSQDNLNYIDSIVETMNKFPQAKLKLIGHTDSSGPAAYNQTLSEKRAQSIADYLYSNGVDKTRVQVVGEGETRPKASNNTGAGRMANRRVEVIIDEFEYQVE